MEYSPRLVEALHNRCQWYHGAEDLKVGPYTGPGQVREHDGTTSPIIKEKGRTGDKFQLWASRTQICGSENRADEAYGWKIITCREENSHTDEVGAARELEKLNFYTYTGKL